MLSSKQPHAGQESNENICVPKPVQESETQTKLIPEIASEITPSRARTQLLLVEDLSAAERKAVAEGRINSVATKKRTGVTESNFVATVQVLAKLFPELFEGKAFGDVAANPSALSASANEPIQPSNRGEAAGRSLGPRKASEGNNGRSEVGATEESAIPPVRPDIGTQKMNALRLFVAGGGLLWVLGHWGTSPTTMTSVLPPTPKSRPEIISLQTCKWGSMVDGYVVEASAARHQIFTFGDLSCSDYDFFTRIDCPSGEYGVIFRCPKRQSFLFFTFGYEAEFDHGNGVSPGPEPVVSLGQQKGQLVGYLVPGVHGDISIAFPQDLDRRPTRFHVAVRGQICSCYLDEEAIFEDVVIPEGFETGSVGLYFRSDGPAKCWFRDIKLLDSEGESLLQELPSLPDNLLGSSQSPPSIGVSLRVPAVE